MDPCAHPSPPGAGPAARADRRNGYQPRRPADGVLHRVLVEHLETFLRRGQERDPDGWGVPATVERALRRCVDCGVAGLGVARLLCERCGKSTFVPFSCKTRGLCPSCGARRMADVAAHLCDHVLPRAPVRQWVVSVPKRVRYFVQRDRALLGALTRLFVHEIERTLRRALGCPTGRAGAVAFVQRFGAKLNAHVHLHVAALDGLYVPPAPAAPAAPDAPPPPGAPAGPDAPPPPPQFVEVRLGTPLDVPAVVERVRRATLRLLVRRGCLDAGAAHDMAAWTHSGFSVHAGVRIEADDRTGLERLLRYCARPPFAEKQLRLLPDGRVLLRTERPGAPGGQQLVLDPLDFLDRLADIAPPARAHLTRFFGVLSSHAALRPLVVPAAQDRAAPVPAPRRADARQSWARLLARVQDVTPACPHCDGPMRIVAFLLDPSELRRFLLAVRADLQVPHLAPARGPPDDDLAFDQTPPDDGTAFLDPVYDEPA